MFYIHRLCAVKPEKEMGREEEEVFAEGKVYWSGGDEMLGIHTLSYSVHTHPQRCDYFRRAVLELYSCPCALSLHCGWRTEPNVSARVSIVKSGRKDILKRGAGKGDRFHSFSRMLTVLNSLRGANQTKWKSILRVDVFQI